MFTTAQPSIIRTAIATLGTAVFAGICLFGATAPAAAAPTDPRVASIVYSDLNLASVSGRKALDNRISQAARAVCDTGSRDLALRAAEKTCINAAIASANARIFPMTASVGSN